MGCVHPSVNSHGKMYFFGVTLFLLCECIETVFLIKWPWVHFPKVGARILRSYLPTLWGWLLPPHSADHNPHIFNLIHQLRAPNTESQSEVTFKNVNFKGVSFMANKGNWGTHLALAQGVHVPRGCGFRLIHACGNSRGLFAFFGILWRGH